MKEIYFEFDGSNKLQKCHRVASPLLLPSLCTHLGTERTICLSLGRRILFCSCLIYRLSWLIVLELLCHSFHFRMHKMFSVSGKSGTQAGTFSIWTLLLWSHAFIMDAVYGFGVFLLKDARPSLKDIQSGWEHTLLENLCKPFCIDVSFPDRASCIFHRHECAPSEMDAFEQRPSKSRDILQNITLKSFHNV